CARGAAQLRLPVPDPERPGHPVHVLAVPHVVPRLDLVPPHFVPPAPSAPPAPAARPPAPHSVPPGRAPARPPGYVRGRCDSAYILLWALSQRPQSSTATDSQGVALVGRYCPDLW